MARQGKIARLPATIREQLNLRLHDNEPAGKILPWLNALPETLRVLDEHFGEEPVTPQNLSEWRKGGYAEWLARRQKVEDLKVLGAFADKLAAANGGQLAAGAQAIAAGRILELLEAGLPTGVPSADADGEDGDEGGSTLESIVLALARLRKLDLDHLRIQTLQRRADQKDEELSLGRAKFEWGAAKLVLEHATSPEVQKIVNSTAAPAVKLEEIHAVLFGRKEVEP